MDTTITMVGTLGADPEAVKAGEHELARFRMAVTRRELRDGRWTDVDTYWMPVEAWHHLGRNVVTSLRKGDPVVVSGLLRTSRWVDANQQRHDRMFVTAQHVGHDLALGTSSFSRAVGGGGQESVQSGSCSDAPAGPESGAAETGSASTGDAAGVMGEGDAPRGDRAPSMGAAAPASGDMASSSDDAAVSTSETLASVRDASASGNADDQPSERKRARKKTVTAG